MCILRRLLMEERGQPADALEPPTTEEVHVMKCHCCGFGPRNGRSLFRVNEKGKPGVWACERCFPPKDTETVRVVAWLELKDGRGRVH